MHVLWTEGPLLGPSPDSAHPSAASGIESLSEAVTHARFVGTNPASDEVVLMKILQVRREAERLGEGGRGRLGEEGGEIRGWEKGE